MREQNGRFMKAPASSKCAGKPLAMKSILSEPPNNDAEAYTHITNSPSFSVIPELTDVAETRPNAFTTPLPS